MMLTGPGLTGSSSFRGDFRTIQEALEQGIAFLRNQPGDWEWLDSYLLGTE